MCISKFVERTLVGALLLILFAAVVGCQSKDLLPKLVAHGSAQIRDQTSGHTSALSEGGRWGWTAGAQLVFEQDSNGVRAGLGQEPPRQELAMQELASQELAMGEAGAAPITTGLLPDLDEPSVDEVVARAQEFALADLQRLKDLEQRARLRGLLPAVSLSARHGQALDLDTQQTEASDRVTVATDRDLTLRAALTFDLPLLVFAREELALNRQRRSQRAAMRELRARVVGVYFERRRLQLSTAGGDGSDVSTQLAIVELTALLDAFTDGGFSRMISARKNKHWVPESGQAVR